MNAEIKTLLAVAGLIFLCGTLSAQVTTATSDPTPQVFQTSPADQASQATQTAQLSSVVQTASVSRAAQLPQVSPFVPGSITLRHANFYDSDGLLIDSQRAESLFGTDLYNGTYLKARHQFQIGRALVICGSVIATPSLLFGGMMFTLFALSNDMSGVAFTMGTIALGGYVAGTLIAGVGIPLMVVGKNSLVRLEQNYNALHGSLSYNPLQRPRPYLSFGSCSRGLGSALNFCSGPVAVSGFTRTPAPAPAAVDTAFTSGKKQVARFPV